MSDERTGACDVWQASILTSFTVSEIWQIARKRFMLKLLQKQQLVQYYWIRSDTLEREPWNSDCARITFRFQSGVLKPTCKIHKGRTRSWQGIFRKWLSTFHWLLIMYIEKLWTYFSRCWCASINANCCLYSRGECSSLIHQRLWIIAGTLQLLIPQH